jgi:hypothetical protein
MHTQDLVDAVGGLYVGGVQVVDTNGKVVGDITAPAGSIGTTELADGAVTTVKLAAGNVTLAKLAAGITPVSVPKYVGTVTWSGSGTSKAQTVTGVLATDIVMATILVAPTQAATLSKTVPTTDTITFTLSAANTSNDAQISYVVYRAAA